MTNIVPFINNSDNADSWVRCKAVVSHPAMKLLINAGKQSHPRRNRLKWVHLLRRSSSTIVVKTANPPLVQAMAPNELVPAKKSVKIMVRVEATSNRKRALTFPWAIIASLINEKRQKVKKNSPKGWSRCAYASHFAPSNTVIMSSG